MRWLGCALLMLLTSCTPAAPPGFDFGVSDVGPGPGPDLGPDGGDGPAGNADAPVDEAPDLGPGADAGDLGPDAVIEAGLYTGTCLAPVIACFDGVPPCVQQLLSGGMPGFVAVFDNGARLTNNFARGTVVAVRSDGTECWSSVTDPATNDYIYTTASGTYRERVEASGREITCPDGEVETAPAGDPPWATVINECEAS